MSEFKPETIVNIRDAQNVKRFEEIRKMQLIREEVYITEGQRRLLFHPIEQKES